MALRRQEDSTVGQIEKFYDEHAQGEWDRLDRYRVEFAATLRALTDYLPATPANVLDVGEAPDGMPSRSLSVATP